MSSREQGKYWLKHEGEWIDGYWDGHCWEDYGHFGLQDSDYDEVGPALLNPDDMTRVKTEAFKAGAAWESSQPSDALRCDDLDEAAHDYVSGP